MLEYLYLGWTPLTDIRDLGECTRLEWLGISGNAIANLVGIEQLAGLRRLDISTTNISDFSPLDDLPFLSTIQISPEMERYLDTLARDDIEILIDGS